MAFINRPKPSSPFTNPLTAAAHDDTGAMIHIGAAVASITYANFALDILCLSVTGFITLPTVRQLK